eukprot:168335_1
MACEPIGNYTGVYGSRKNGKSLNHDQIEHSVRIKGCLKATKANRRIVCAGVSNWLVDMDKGVLKSGVEKNKKKQKFPEIGKVILRLNEAIATRKYHVPMLVNSAEIRSILHQMNDKHQLNSIQSEIDKHQSNNSELKQVENIDTYCDMQCDVGLINQSNILISDENIHCVKSDDIEM